MIIHTEAKIKVSVCLIVKSKNKTTQLKPNQWQTKGVSQLTVESRQFGPQSKQYVNRRICFNDKVSIIYIVCLYIVFSRRSRLLVMYCGSDKTYQAVNSLTTKQALNLSFFFFLFWPSSSTYVLPTVYIQLSLCSVRLPPKLMCWLTFCESAHFSAASLYTEQCHSNNMEGCKLYLSENDWSNKTNNEGHGGQHDAAEHEHAQLVSVCWSDALSYSTVTCCYN